MTNKGKTRFIKSLNEKEGTAPIDTRFITIDLSTYVYSLRLKETTDQAFPEAKKHINKYVSFYKGPVKIMIHADLMKYMQFYFVIVC